ncbi:MAG: sugar phosphate isomerase/epimerase [Candidatus Brocadiia bacterium]
MQLGLCSAILPDLSLEAVAEFAAGAGFECVELMCWPPGKAERRYAGVTHVDVTELDQAEADRIEALLHEAGVAISGLGYYPNPLAADEDEAGFCIEHIKRVIAAAPMLGVTVVNTFIGRDPAKSVEANWPVFQDRWPPLVEFAEGHSVRIGIENCPMLFTEDEWPGGKNLAHSPAVWRRMFEEIPSEHFGLNYDPSHLIWQGIDPVAPLREFADRVFHVHAKDARVDMHRLDDVGVLAHPLEFHTPKLPGLGDVDWGRFFSVLTDVGYDGPVCVEVEDRAYEGALERRKAALVQSARFLRQYMA